MLAAYSQPTILFSESVSAQRTCTCAEGISSSTSFGMSKTVLSELFSPARAWALVLVLGGKDEEVL